MISADRSIREAIACIDQNAKGVVLVVDQHRRLIDTVTDGDIRRGILRGISLDKPLSCLIGRDAESSVSKPVTALLGTEREALLKLMHDRGVRQIPLLDEENRVAGLVTLDELFPSQILPLQAVVMAGGLGTRLRPLTEEVPKPMLPIGGRPLMEHLIQQLRDIGIRQVNVATHYRPDKIRDHFGDGRDFGVNLNYVNEDSPLGTAGALGLMDGPREPLLVINGDILTQVDFRAMIAYHHEHRAEMTVAVRRYDVQVPYGVMECEGVNIRRVTEKPQLVFFVNAGIYLLDPPVYDFIPNGQRFDMTDLIQCLLDAGRTVVSFPIREYWLDIGQHSDYVQAQADIKKGRMGA